MVNMLVISMNILFLSLLPLLSAQQIDLSIGSADESPPHNTIRQLLSSKCNPLLGVDAMGCVTDTFVSNSDGWFSQQMGNPKMKALLTDMIKKCTQQYLLNMVGSTTASLITKALGNNMPQIGPYDKLICNILDAARKGDPKQIDILKLDKCKGAEEEAVDKECKQQFLGGSSSFDLMKSVVTAVAGIGDTNSEIVKGAVASYKSCSDGGKPVTECVGRGLVVYSCESVCQTSQCQMKKYHEKGNEECRKALDTNCEAGFDATNQLCHETAKAMISQDFKPQDCKSNCQPITTTTTSTKSFYNLSTSNTFLSLPNFYLFAALSFLLFH